MSKSNKKDVGKGIRALLSNIDKKESRKGSTVLKPESSGTPNKLPLGYIEPNPYQPRTEFDTEKLEELIQSISTHGIIQPIAVRKLNSKAYQIISGERRWRAAKHLKLEKVPVHILEADDQAMLEIALLENIQRADLNPIEISISYQRLIDECNLTHEELSERLGKKRSSITNHLRLLKLSPSVQEAVSQDKISLGHAKVLAGIEHVEIQTMILGRILRDGLSVRATEQIVKASTKSKKKSVASTPSSDANLESVKKKMSELLGTSVQISRSASGKGFLKIPFTSDIELNDVIELIMDK